MRIILAACLALALAACNTVNQAKVDQTIDQTVPIACAGVDLAWAGFEAYKASKPVKADLVVKANAAYFTAKDICANPPTDSTSALIAILKASAVFNSAIKAAKNGSTTGTGS